MRALALILASFLAAGCVSVFPKTAPDQLYRFGATPLARPVAPAGARPAVEALPIDFDRAAAGDLILTLNGDEAAYIKGSRWITSASSLFEQAMESAFAADQGTVRLMARGEAVRPDYLLKLSVRGFEARYTHGRSAAPDIVVEVYAAISKSTDRTLAGEKTFTVSVPAADNRMGAIAGAFDSAVGRVLSELVSWVDTTISAYPAAKPA